WDSELTLVFGSIAPQTPNTVAFYFHERVWQRFGARPRRESGHGHGNLVPSERRD
ncbi:TPA: DUF2061 domain-containing protein, partial [Pseudomonas aeruginosa]|nr:DUF2061 domain-containing protein [Pseudomonas aeruginosa]